MLSSYATDVYPNFGFTMPLSTSTIGANKHQRRGLTFWLLLYCSYMAFSNSLCRTAILASPVGITAPAYKPQRPVLRSTNYTQVSKHSVLQFPSDLDGINLPNPGLAARPKSKSLPSS